MLRSALPIALATFLAMPLAAQSIRYDGIWAIGDPSACVEGRDHVNFAYRIQNGEMTGLESSCFMTNPVEVRDMSATLYDMDCAGEGETWTFRMMLMIDRDGALVRVTDGQALISPRCTGFAPGSIAPVPPAAPSK